MNIILLETDQRNYLLPLCYTRPVASSHICPTDELVEQIRHLSPGERIIWQGIPVIVGVNRQDAMKYPVPVNQISWSDFRGERGLVRYSFGNFFGTALACKGTGFLRRKVSAIMSYRKKVLRWGKDY